MHFSFLTLFPQLIEGYFSDSILKNARENGLISIETIQIRDFATNAYKSVDMPQIGGGAGQVISYEVLSRTISSLQKTTSQDTRQNQAQISSQDFALDSTQDFVQYCIKATNQTADKNSSKNKNASKNTDTNIYKTARPHIIFLTPCAKPFTQNDAKRLAKKPHIAFVCGRYEGVDERAIEAFADEVFCIGDFILTGGELAALCLCDSIARNISGVLGNSESLQGESFENYLLEAPVFARHIKGKNSKNETLDGFFTDFYSADVGFSCQASAKNDKNFVNFIAPSVYSKGNHSRISVLKNDLAVCKTRYFRPNLFEKWKIHNPNNPKKKG